MSIKQIVFSIILLIFFVNISHADAASNASDKRLSSFWSVVRTKSIYDSLKTGVQQASLLDIKTLKDYLDALQFRELLKASDKPPRAFPSSAGVYDSSLT